MYSGTTIRVKSGRLMGVHQRIDKAAYRQFRQIVGRSISFPRLHDILHFEGLNGPDGIKRKSPGRDEPWHYIDPQNPDDTQLTVMIDDHLHNLTEALKRNDMTRSAFEASWLAHAITDGLTPAHHYPLEAKLEELRDGASLETRSSAKEKLVLPGKNRREKLRNNWEFWGAKGVMTTHLAFELGVATTSTSQRFEHVRPADDELLAARTEAFEPHFRRALEEIDSMQMYQEFARLGWTRHLAEETRVVLMPTIIKTVVLAWYSAIHQAKDQS